MATTSFEASRAIRAICSAAGKPLTAYADGTCCSAGYALASGASMIVASPTSTVGSIGVVTQRDDVTEMMARDGFKTTFITSGSKKAFGNPETAATDAELMDTQRQINTLAGMFFNLIQEHRGIPAAQVGMMDAGVFIGQEAANAGLVDAVGSFESLFAQDSQTSNNKSDGEAVSDQTQEAQVSFAEVLEALKAIAAGDSEDCESAKRMLSAMEAEAPAEEENPAEDAPAEEPVEEEEEEAASVGGAAEAAQAAAASADLLAELAVLKQEVAALKAPKAQRPVAITTVQPAKQPAKKSSSPEDIALDKAFGLHKEEGPAVSVRGSVQTFRLIGR